MTTAISFELMADMIDTSIAVRQRFMIGYGHKVPVSMARCCLPITQMVSDAPEAC